MKEQKIIMWDLMGTLISPSFGQSSVKPGIESTLERLSNQGFSHHITSLAKRDAVARYLEDAKLSHRFDKLWGVENLGKISTQQKTYDGVLSELNITEEEARKRILVIGDSEADYPGMDILFILNKKGCQRSAAIEEAMIDKLQKLDVNDLGAAYKSLYDSIASTDVTKRVSISGYDFSLKRFNLGMNIGGNTYYRPKIEVLG